MKFHFLVFAFFITINFFGQENIVIETQYKYKPNKELAKENFNFNFLVNEGKLILKDLELGFRKEYLIQFYNTSYSLKGDKFLLAYSTDIKKHYATQNDKKDVNMFTIIYDKKLGNVLAVKIQSVTGRADQFYLTGLGKKIIHDVTN